MVIVCVIVILFCGKFAVSWAGAVYVRQVSIFGVVFAFVDVIVADVLVFVFAIVLLLAFAVVFLFLLVAVVFLFLLAAVLVVFIDCDRVAFVAAVKMRVVLCVGSCASVVRAVGVAWAVVLRIISAAAAAATAAAAAASSGAVAKVNVTA